MWKTLVIVKVKLLFWFPAHVCPALGPWLERKPGLSGWWHQDVGALVWVFSLASVVCFCFLQSRKTRGLRWPPLPLKTGPLTATLSQMLPRSRKAQSPSTSRMPCLVCPHLATSWCPTPPSQVSGSCESLSFQPAGPPICPRSSCVVKKRPACETSFCLSRP